MTTRYFFIYTFKGQELADSFTGPDMGKEGVYTDKEKEFLVGCALQKIADNTVPFMTPEGPTTVGQLSGDVKSQVTVTKLWSDKYRNEILN